MGKEEEENAWKKLGSPTYIVAPMVDASELPWRMLCRKYGAHLCYTPMIHSHCFVKSVKYRKQYFVSCEKDRPLVVQFSGNNPDTLLEAALLVEPYCDCVDINLGCPQQIAKRGHYGAYLQDDWELLTQIVSTLRRHLKVPVSCKIRIFEDVQKSVKYAQLLESAGCQLLTVHGRVREQKGPLTGIASWEHIKAIKDALKIPVIANGNIQCLTDVHHCLNFTGCEGVMSAEGILSNPALFSTKSYPVWEMALEYLDLVTFYPCPVSYMRGHLFKLLYHVLLLPGNEKLRNEMGQSKNYEGFRRVVISLKEKYEPIHLGKFLWEYIYSDYNMILPPWICQPYVRLSPEEHLKKISESQNRNIFLEDVDEKEFASKRLLESCENTSVILSKKLKNSRLPNNVPPKQRRVFEKCTLCPNPQGLKCEYKLCKICCRKKCLEGNLCCPSHRRTKKECNTEIIQTADKFER